MVRVLFLLASALPFIAYGAMSVMENVMLADAVDYGEWKSGRRNAGVIFSMLTFLSKIANGVSQGLTFGAFALVGFHAETETAPTPQAVVSFKVLLFAVPVVFLLLAALLHHKKFRLKPELVQTISQELLNRRTAANETETEVLS